jgi:RHS repeat-associated protein
MRSGIELKVSTTNSGAELVSVIYDEFDRVHALIDPLGNKVSTLYDQWGSEIARIDPLGNKTSRVYDDMGRVVGEIDPLGHQYMRHYDDQGRVAAEIDSLGAKTTFEYNAKGQRIAVIDALGNRTAAEYDAMGQKTVEIDALGNRTIFSYDSDGKLVKRVDARGLVTFYSYDAAGNQTRIAYSDGKEAIFDYDALSQKTRVKDWTGETRYEYDAVGNMTAVHYPSANSLHYAYDANGRRVSMIDHNGGKTSYRYDVAGNLVAITNPFGETTSIQYDALRREISKTSANGVKQVCVYDAVGNETSRRYVTSAQAVLAAYNAKYDAAGNRTHVAEYDGSTISYAYDSTYQLLSENRTGSNAFHAAYTYDPLGNRLTKTHNGSVTHYEYGAGNVITKLTDPLGSVTEFAHDASGNLVSATKDDNTTLYGWDTDNNLVSVRKGESKEEYVYNIDGVRISKKVEGFETRFIWDSVNVLAEIDASDKTLAYYTDTPGQWGDLVSAMHTGKSQYFAYDLSSNTRHLTDHDGNLTAVFAYDAFGSPLTETPSDATPYRFGGMYGYQSDTDERVYVRARHYSTVTGRWDSRDPMGLTGGDWNLHRYVGNRVVHVLDPSGLDANQCEWCVANVYTPCMNKLRDVDAAISVTIDLLCAAANIFEMYKNMAGGCAKACSKLPFKTPNAVAGCELACAAILAVGCTVAEVCLLKKLEADTDYCGDMLTYCERPKNSTMKKPTRPGWCG